MERGAEYCEKCPKGFFSQYGFCQPCAVGEYTLFAGSEECYKVDSESFIAWPASTLSEKKSCDKEECPGQDFRTCSADGDAFCQKCPTLTAGHKTFFDPAQEKCVVEPCGKDKYSPNGCLGEDCCLPCVSSCVAGQHSVGCGSGDENSAHTKNTECAPCPIDTFTEFDAGASCADGDNSFKMIPDVGSQCEVGIGSPHKAGTFTSANPFRWLSKKYTVNWPTVVDRRTTGDNPPIGAAVQNPTSCCSAAAFQCVPCRTDKVTYSTSWNGRYFGRSNQPVWSTNGLTGQTFCQSYWHLWAYQTYKDIAAFDEEQGKPKDDGT